MALIPCRECRMQVSADARFCPHCGASRPGKPKLATADLNKFWGRPIVIGALIIAAVLVPSYASRLYLQARSDGLLYHASGWPRSLRKHSTSLAHRLPAE